MHWLIFFSLVFFQFPIWGNSADLSRGHSHNDYEQKHPLFDALKEGLNSVEADIWYRNGKILVSHLGHTFKGSLEDLYLKPLQEIANRGATINGGMFYLWIDIKDKNPKLRSELRSILERYPMLTTFGEEKVVLGAVTIILTGNDKSKKLFVEETPVSKASHDGIYKENDPPGNYRWSWYAIKWSNYYRQNLIPIVASIHAKGRRVRFWGIPNKESIWGEAMRADVDLISVDDLPRFSRFLQNF